LTGAPGEPIPQTWVAWLLRPALLVAWLLRPALLGEPIPHSRVFAAISSLEAETPGEPNPRLWVAWLLRPALLGEPIPLSRVFAATLFLVTETTCSLPKCHLWGWELVPGGAQSPS
jgi:hypothetical protein